MDNKKTVVSGMRPTGRLHLGNWFGALKNWVSLQDRYNCFFFIADWHSLTTGYEKAANAKNDARDMLIDWLAAGLDPEKTVIFRQSDIKEHAELYLSLGMIIPISWLLRNPTFKEQLAELYAKKYKGQEDKMKGPGGMSKILAESVGSENNDSAAVNSDLSTYGFLGYPVLQAADILMYNADFVPVGKDQLPHLELTREIARRFNHIFKTEIFKEPASLLTSFPYVPGTDSAKRKMSKSYGNAIDMGEDAENLKKKIMGMYTDPSKEKANDPGHPEGCSVFAFYALYDEPSLAVLKSDCEKGAMGCVKCKRKLIELMAPPIEEFRKKREKFKKADLDGILKKGAAKAGISAREMMKKTNEAIFKG